VAKLSCLHCGQPLRTRSSRRLLPTSTELFLECTSFDCRATYGAAIEITHGITPSAIPNPSVQLRMAPPRRRALPQPANDDGAFGARAPEVAPPATANDNDGCGEAVATGT
jgi:hypothetical protein